MTPAVPHLFPAHTTGIVPRFLTLPLVKIRHPSYPTNHKSLMEFLAVDNGGIDYDLAYYACCLLVDNAWIREESNRPYFSLIPTPNGRFERPANGILPVNVYYFHDPLYPTLPYPITPGFRHWSFPHNNLPPPWRNLNIAPVPAHKSMRAGGREAIIARDECCRMTLALSSVEKAHIVPKAEELWFTENNMDPYLALLDESKKIHDVNNLILLRADVHLAWDAKAILFLPKLRDGRYILVSHLLHSINETRNELHGLYHNRPLQQLYGVSPECLFARFAWTILESSTVQLIDTIKTDPIAIIIREDARNSVGPTSRVIYVTSADQVPRHTSTAAQASTSNKRSRSGTDGRRRQAAEEDPDEHPSSQWDSAVVRARRRQVDSDSDRSVDSDVEDYSRPLKRGRLLSRPLSRPSSRPGTPPLPSEIAGSMPGSLGTLPGSTRSNSSTATKVDTVANPKVSEYDPETNQIVPIKRVD